MKALLATLLLLTPFTTQATCAATDFAVQNFEVAPTHGEGMNMKGALVNHCAEAAAAQVQIDAKDATGRVLQSKKGWPAGTTNIAPGQSADFNLGRLFHYDSSMQTYTVSIISVRSW